jgi:hypothetical protein
MIPPPSHLLAPNAASFVSSCSCSNCRPSLCYNNFRKMHRQLIVTYQYIGLKCHISLWRTLQREYFYVLALTSFYCKRFIFWLKWWKDIFIGVEKIKIINRWKSIVLVQFSGWMSPPSCRSLYRIFLFSIVQVVAKPVIVKLPAFSSFYCSWYCHFNKIHSACICFFCVKVLASDPKCQQCKWAVLYLIEIGNNIKGHSHVKCWFS